FVVEFVRLSQGTKYGFFGFDHVEINDLNSGPQTTNITPEASIKSTVVTKDSTITIHSTGSSTTVRTISSTTSVTTSTEIQTVTTTTNSTTTTTTVPTTTTTSIPTTTTVPTTTTTSIPTTTTVPTTTTTSTTTTISSITPTVSETTTISVTSTTLSTVSTLTTVTSSTPTVPTSATTKTIITSTTTTVPATNTNFKTSFSTLLSSSTSFSSIFPSSSSTSETSTKNPTFNYISCSFDNYKCPFSLNKNNSDFTYLATNFSIPKTNFTITSWNSFNLPTQNKNKRCIIPFIFQSLEYNYCANIDKKFQCFVGNSTNGPVYDECKNELFLIANAPKSGEVFNSIGKFTLKVDNTGKYNVNFSTIMYCADLNCSKALDYIKLTARFETKSRLDRDIKIAEILLDSKNENKWREHSYLLNIKDKDEQNFKIIVEIGRKEQNKAINYMGFDGLTLSKSENQDDDSGTNIWAILGGVGGSLIVIILIVIIINMSARSKSDKMSKENDYIDDNFNSIQMEPKSSPRDDFKDAEEEIDNELKL
ncbi:unnamed protein product, partial [Brachionus calyciflorus]